MATHVNVVPKSEWKSLFIEPHLLQQTHMASLIGIQELTDYTLEADTVNKSRKPPVCFKELLSSFIFAHIYP